MKKIFAILFSILLLFNVLGYYGLFLGLQYKNDVRMIQRLDSESYDSSQTVTIKIPITIPYASDSKDYERVDGKFEHNGEFYRLVKQRLSRDTLFIVCVKDYETKRISQAFTSYVKTFSEEAAESSTNAKIMPTFIKDFFTCSFSIKSASFGWESDVVKVTSEVVFISSYYPSIIRPPERL